MTTCRIRLLCLWLKGTALGGISCQSRALLTKMNNEMRNEMIDGNEIIKVC